MTTIGNRYVDAIKRRVTELTTTKDKNLPKLEKALDARKTQLSAVIAGGFKLPANTPVEIKHYDGLGKYDNSEIEVNGIEATMSGPQLVAIKGVRASANAMQRAKVKLEESRKQFCKEHEMLTKMQASDRINAFKAFARARMDKDDNIKKLGDKMFKALVADFLETQRSHVCPL